MKFEFKNIGSIKNAKIELGKLTLLGGKNNTGKTYLTYTVFGFLNKINFNNFFYNEIYKSLFKQYKCIISLKTLSEKINKFLITESNTYSEQIYSLFSANPEAFKKSIFTYIDNINLNILIEKEININKDDLVIEKDKKSDKITIKLDKNKKYVDFLLFRKLQKLLINIFSDYHFSNTVFILSAERTGIHIFQNELDKNRSELVNNLIKKNKLSSQQMENVFNHYVSRYALPLEKNIDFIRDLENIQKENSFLKEKHPELLTYIENMLGVNYQIIDGRLIVIDKKTNTAIPSYLSSTSVRSLFSLHLWLKHKAQKGDLLMIDEPELNLHPENQIKITRLIAMLINSGIRVWVTTHSDYIIKELNNLMMLSNNFDGKDKLMTKFSYTKNEILSTSDVKAYLALPEGIVQPIDIDEYGFIQSSFDDTIVEMNKCSNDLITAIENIK